MWRAQAQISVPKKSEEKDASVILLAREACGERIGYAEVLDVFMLPFTPFGKKPPELAFAAFPYAK